MTTISPSSIDAIHGALRSQNPFDRPVFVKQQDVWDGGFPDVPSLNSHVSDAVFDAIEKIRTGQRASLGLTIRAERGLGKSHLIGRIRHRLQQEGGGLFVYMSEFSNLSRIKEEFLQTLAHSLKRTGSQGVMQWQELATALVSDAYKQGFQAKDLVDNQFPRKVKEILARGAKPIVFVNHLAERVRQTRPEVDNPYLLQAILWTLSKPHASFAINWLAGKGIAQAHADEMGLPYSTSEDKETDSFDSVRQILNLIGVYQPLVICFDEMDSAGSDEHGMPKAMVVASLVKDVCNSLKKVVVLSAMYEETWKEQINIMPNAKAVIDRIGEKVFDLNYLNSDNVVALVSKWLKDFYEERNLIPPTPVYPFDEVKLRELGKEKPIVRYVLKWCEENLKIPGGNGHHGDEGEITKTVESAYDREFADLEWSIEDYLEDENTLIFALHLGFYALVGETIEGVQVKEIQEVEARAADQGYINFRIFGKEGKKTVKIGVSVVQQSGGAGVSTALKRLVDYKTFDLTRGCLVRSKSIAVTSVKAQEYLRQLLVKQSGEWVLLTGEHIKSLLALSFVYNRLEDYELDEAEFFEFVRQKKLASDNLLLREILSKPSGKVPNNVANEDLPISIPTAVTTSESASLPELTIAAI